MDGTNLIKFFSDNFSTVGTIIGGIGKAVIAAVFLRRNESVLEFEKIKAGIMGDVCKELLESGRMTYYKANNFMSIAQKADQYSQEFRNKPGKKISFDWAMRFYEAAGNVSEEEMQELWARLLAGEVTNEEMSYSLLTIQTLSLLTTDDAKDFMEFCSNLIRIKDYEPFLPQYEEFLDNVGLSADEVKKMMDLGLLSPMDHLATSPVLHLEAKKEGCDIIEEADVPLPFRGYLLTKAGLEISTLFEWETNKTASHEFTNVFNNVYQESLAEMEENNEIDSEFPF